MEQSSDKPIAEKKKGFRWPKIRANWKKVRLGVAGLVFVAAVSGASSYLTIAVLKSQGDLANKTTQISNYTISSDTDLVNIVNQISKSVVNISTRTVTYGWFGRQSVSEGAGTGIIISTDGYILTNNHVVSDSDSITVIVSGDDELTATVVKTDSSKDLALIKVSSETQLTAAKIGDSDSARVGETVIAVGNVMGRYTDSVTKGIISGLGRPIVASGSTLYGDLEELEDLIQTDAAINSGNSGGPLVNMKGEVIGINTAIDGTAQNIGFAVPINHAGELIDSIK